MTILLPDSSTGASNYILDVPVDVDNVFTLCFRLAFTSVNYSCISELTSDGEHVLQMFRFSTKYYNHT